MNSTRSDEDFVDGEKAEALFDKEKLGRMITTEFQMEGFIPYNISIIVDEMALVDEDLLGVKLIIKKESFN